jgi:hypothetical protein
MKKFHIAIGVADIDRSVEDYSRRLECAPSVVIPNEYALWRTASVNFSIRRVTNSPGILRHLGWEDESASTFSQDSDVNGVIWEQFNAKLQAREIKEAWPQSDYAPGKTQ